MYLKPVLFYQISTENSALKIQGFAILKFMDWLKFKDLQF